MWANYLNVPTLTEQMICCFIDSNICLLFALFSLWQNPNAASPLGQMPPNDAIPSGSIPPGFFPNSQMRPSPVSQPSPHPQQPPPPPPPHGQMMPNQFMSPRYPSGPGPGPRPGVRMPQQVDFSVSTKLTNIYNKKEGIFQVQFINLLQMLKFIRFTLDMFHLSSFSPLLFFYFSLPSST